MVVLKLDLSDEAARFIEEQPPELQGRIIELRSLILSSAPNASEKRVWDTLCYFDEERGGPIKGSICQIEVKGKNLRLSFIHGAFLKDPEGLLKGDAVAKRHILIEDPGEREKKYLADLISQAG